VVRAGAILSHLTALGIVVEDGGGLPLALATIMTGCSISLFL